MRNACIAPLLGPLAPARASCLPGGRSQLLREWVVDTIIGRHQRRCFSRAVVGANVLDRHNTTRHHIPWNNIQKEGARPRNVPGWLWGPCDVRGVKTSGRRSPVPRASQRATATNKFVQRKPASQIDPSEIWRVYEETQGMPLPGGELGQTQIKEHLGPNVNVELGNHILRVLQYRRHSGSLSEEGLVFPAEDNVSEEVAEKALDYLRLQDPMDEVAASERWAEEEAARMEDKFIQGATRVGLYARTPEEEQQQQGTAYGRERTGTSVLDRIKERHEIKMKEKEKEREERAAALEAEENSGTLQAAGQTGELAVRDKPEWVKYWEEKAAVSSATEAPDTGFFRRVLPSAIVAAAIVGGCVLLSSLYAPPSKSARLWPDTPPSAATHITLVGLNTLVFLLWKFPPAWPTLNRYFLQVPGYPIALSVIGNVFSHQTIKHLVFNMLVLCAVGPQLHDQVGRGNFLAIYLASGALGSMSSLASYALRRNFTTSSFGASGAVCGIVAARCLLVPSTHLGVPMTDYKVPFTSTVLLGCLISGELVAMYVKRHRPTVDYVAHLGGYATGIAGSLGLKRRFEERRRLAAERNPFTKVFGAHNGRDSKP